MEEGDGMEASDRGPGGRSSARRRRSAVKGPQEMSRPSNTMSIAAGLAFVALLWGCGKAPDAPTVEGRPEATPTEVVEAGKSATQAPEDPRLPDFQQQADESLTLFHPESPPACHRESLYSSLPPGTDQSSGSG